MRSFWQSFYNLCVVPVFLAFFRISSFWDDKMRRGIVGRRNLFTGITDQVRRIPPGRRVWIHSSSMGEFEQAKPLITWLRHNREDIRIIVTFFSPSGYENSREYPLADLVCYLPFDTKSDAGEFIDLINPDLALFVRYDVWPNHIWTLQRKGVPSVIANATIARLTLRRVPFVRSFHRSVYGAFIRILTVSEPDADTFQTFGLDRSRLICVGDTRFDQVIARSTEAEENRVLPEGIVSERKIVVAGSCWSEDDEVVFPAFARLLNTIPDALLIHVPHEPTQSHIDHIEQTITGKFKVIRLSSLDRYSGEHVIIVDSIGKLLDLYAAADVAFVGGSFGAGIHNVLEAAVYGIPVLFGPHHQNSQEPIQLLEQGGGFVAEDSSALLRALCNLLMDDVARKEVGRRAGEFVRANTGATERVLERIGTYIGSETESLEREPTGAAR